MKILVTGGSGFVGRALIEALVKLNGVKVVATYRDDNTLDIPNIEIVDIGNISECEKWESILVGVDIVIHTAARAHVMNDIAKDPLAEYRATNVQGTLKLAKQASEVGVKRFIFISSIKVNGKSTSEGNPFKFNDLPNPKDPYGVSKYEAEIGLKEICADVKMEFVIIRPPLVYGLGVKANFSAMMSLAKKNLPLPLGAIDNKRSFVALSNLVDLIKTCIDHKNASNQIFLVSDGSDISTSELLKIMIKSYDKKPWLIPIPVNWILILGKVLGKKNTVDRLCCNLQVDIEHTKSTLGWEPKFCIEDVLSKLV